MMSIDGLRGQHQQLMAGSGSSPHVGGSSALFEDEWEVQGNGTPYHHTVHLPPPTMAGMGQQQQQMMVQDTPVYQSKAERLLGTSFPTGTGNSSFGLSSTLNASMSASALHTPVASGSSPFFNPTWSQGPALSPRGPLPPPSSQQQQSDGHSHSGSGSGSGTVPGTGTASSNGAIAVPRPQFSPFPLTPNTRGASPPVRYTSLQQDVPTSSSTMTSGSGGGAGYHHHPAHGSTGSTASVSVNSGMGGTSMVPSSSTSSNLGDIAHRVRQQDQAAIISFLSRTKVSPTSTSKWKQPQPPSGMS